MACRSFGSKLKEQRRDLVVALMGRSAGPVSKEQIAEIAAVQHVLQPLRP
jgi:hypothetical protein